MPGIAPSGPSARTNPARLAASRIASRRAADDPHEGQDQPAVHRPGVAGHRDEVTGGDRDLRGVDEDGAPPGHRQLRGRTGVIRMHVGQQDGRRNLFGAKHGSHDRPDALGVLLPARVDQHPRGPGTDQVGVGLGPTPRPQAEHVRGDLGGGSPGRGPRRAAPAPPEEHRPGADECPGPRHDRDPLHARSVPEGPATRQRRTARHEAVRSRRPRTVSTAADGRAARPTLPHAGQPQVRPASRNAATLDHGTSGSSMS